MHLEKMRNRSARKLLLLLLMTTALATAPGQELTAMPVPAKVTPGAGSFSIDGGFQVVFEGFKDARLERARDRFLAQLSRRTGILCWPAASPAQPQFLIRTAGPGAAVQQLGEVESYRLEITPAKILLSAPNPLGILHGLQTFLQLVEDSRDGFTVQSVTIEDSPRFPWRGLMIDVGRHFMPLDVIRQNLDLMEAMKLNVFHWHLTDDQGFRVESKTHPLLQGKGSDGMYYSQAEIRDIVAYARDRGIRVVPEFDMPAHATSWFPGYPELASGKGPYGIARKWGVLDPAMDPTRESTYAFLDSFLGEMTGLFPDAFFHIGGDECNGKEWDANPRIQQFMRAHNFKDNAALQAYFTSRVQKLVTRHGKETVGWDEVLQPGTPKDVVIQSWRGQDSLAQAARGGNRGLLSWGYYLDLNEPAGQHYAVDPMGKGASQLAPEEQTRILGGEAAMWSELVTPENITGRIWPRAAAIAERLWSSQNVRDTSSMYRRLALVSESLAWYGLNPSFTERPAFQRLTVDGDRSSLKVLADVVEPPKGYAREGLRSYDAYTPLNRMVDVVPAESDQAREFLDLASRIASGAGSPADFSLARQWLTKWRDNDSVLQPHLQDSSLTAELVPVSKDLSRAAVLGLVALDSLQKGSRMAGSARQAALGELKSLEAPKAVLLDKVVPGVEVLVLATKS